MMMILATFVFLLLKRCSSLLKPIENDDDDDDFSYFCLLLLKRCCSPTKAPPSRTGKHHGPEGRTRPRIAPKKSLTSLLKPIENDDWSYFCLLLLKRCCSPTTKSLTSLLKPIEHEDFSYFCLLLLKRCCSPTKTPPSRTGKHHGPEGRTSPRIAPKNSLTSLLKPIEKERIICFELLFCLLLLKRCCSPTTKSLTSLLKPIENDGFSYFCLLLLKRCCSPTKTPPSRTGKHHGPEGRTSPRIAPKNSLTSLLKPIEKERIICFELLFCLLLLKRCCSPTTKSLTSLLKSIENDDFSYFCLLLLKRCCSPTKTPPSRTGKHQGPEGRTSPRIAPKKSLTSLLKPIEKDIKG